MRVQEVKLTRHINELGRGRGGSYEQYEAI